MVCILKADKCMSKCGKYVQRLVHLGQRVCKMEIWEIKLGELFGTESLLEFWREDRGGTQ